MSYFEMHLKLCITYDIEQHLFTKLAKFLMVSVLTKTWIFQ